MRRRTDEQKFGLESNESNADESSLAYLRRICRSLMISEIEFSVLSAASFLSKMSYIVFRLIAMEKRKCCLQFFGQLLLLTVGQFLTRVAKFDTARPDHWEKIN